MEINPSIVTGLDDSTLTDEIGIEEVYPDDDFLTDEEMEEQERDYDGQPSEYDEWQDFYGGDDNPRDWDNDGFFEE